MSDPFDILVAGSGVVGKAMALASARNGLRAVVTGVTAPRSRVWAVADRAWRWLARLAPAIDKTAPAEPVTEIRVEAEGRRTKISAPGSAEESPEILCRIVEEDMLDAALMESVRATEGVVVTGRRLASFERVADGLSCHLEGEGEPIPTRLLIGCDGTESTVRVAAGLHELRRSHRACALCCVIAADMPEPSVARQNFLPDGPLALLPMSSGRAAMIFSVSEELAGGLASLDADAFCAEIRARSGDFTGRFGLASQRRTFPIQSRIATGLRAPNVVLVGESAHGLHPLAGQGLNLGLGDAAMLAGILERHRRCGLDIGAPSALREYERRRYPAILAMGTATEALAFLFRAPKKIRAAAAAGMGAWFGNPFAAQWAIEAAGHARTFRFAETMEANA